MKRLLITLSAMLVSAVLQIGCSDSPNAPDEKQQTKVESKTYIGPELTIHTPSRAAMVQDGTLEDYPLTINGLACDSFHVITNVEIDDQTISLTGDPPCKQFNFEYTSRCGLSIVKGEVENDVGQKGLLAQAFLRSPEFFPKALNTNLDARAESALFLQLNQNLLDDHDRSDLDDVASIADRILRSIDINDVVGFVWATPDDNEDGRVDRECYSCGVWPLEWTECNYKTGIEISKHGNARHNGISVTRMDLTESGLVIEVLLKRPVVRLEVRGHLNNWCLGELNVPVYGDVWIEGDLRIIVTAAVSSNPTSGKPVVSIPSVDIKVGDNSIWTVWDNVFLVDIDCGPLDYIGIGYLIDLAANKYAVLAQTFIVDVAGFIGDEIKPILEDNLEALTFPNTITLPSPFNISLHVDAGIDYSNFSSESGQMASYVQVWPESPKAAHLGKPFGPICFGGEKPSFSSSEYSFGVGLKDDFFNHFLWAAWLGGAFDLEDISEFLEQYMVPGLELTIFSDLPPVIMPGRDEWEIEMGWGDLYIDMSVPTLVMRNSMSLYGVDASLVETVEDSDTIHVGAYVSAIIGGAMDIDMDSYSFNAALDAQAEVAVQVMEINDPRARTAANLMIDRLLQKALPQILSSAMKSFPLPEFDLGSVHPELANVVWRLENGAIERRGNYYCLTGKLGPKP